MIKAIVYKSNTGHTKQYAEMLAEKTGLPVYDIKAAKKSLQKGIEIIFMGWLKIGKVIGLKSAASRYTVKAVAGVGMTAKEQFTDISSKNKIPQNVAVFSLNGGFEIEKLKGINKLMMKTMSIALTKALSTKHDLTEDEKMMFDLVSKGGNKVEPKNLDGIFDWYTRQA